MDKVTLQTQLGAAARAQREAQKYSQDTFADAIGMHRAYYSAIERGERNLTIFTIWRVAEGLGLEVSELLKEAGL